MESMIYVVLYCGLLCLPHKLNGVALKDLLKSFFDAYQLRSGVPLGGHSKISNKTTRLTTGAIKWKSRGMTTWLGTMMDMFSPISGHTDSKYKDKWTPQAVDAWWTSFLHEYDLRLAKNDRRDNLRHSDNWTIFKNRAPIHAFGKPHQGTQPSADIAPAQYANSTSDVPAHPTIPTSAGSKVKSPAKRGSEYMDFKSPVSAESHLDSSSVQVQLGGDVAGDVTHRPKRARRDDSSAGTYTAYGYDSDASMRTLSARNMSGGEKYAYSDLEFASGSGGDDVSMASGSRLSDADDASMLSGSSAGASSSAPGNSTAVCANEGWRKVRKARRDERSWHMRELL